MARIAGLGSYLPSKVLSNGDLEKIVETSDEWIVSRTGIKERRIASAQETTSFMGAEAAKQALLAARCPVNEIDMILVATLSGDTIIPSTAALIQAAIGAEKAAAMDIQAACTGFIYGLSLAKAFLESGTYKNILLIGSEKLSSFVDYTDRNTCVLFGDGAAAAVISLSGEGFTIDGLELGVDGQQACLIDVPAGGCLAPATVDTVRDKLHYIRMIGKEVFKHAVRRMASSIQCSLDKMNLPAEKISWLVPHQANMRIIDALAKQFSLPEERIYKTIQKYGNTSASSVPIALHELVTVHSISTGENILLVAFGAGLTWGSAVLTKVEG